MYVLLIYYYAVSRVHPWVFCTSGYGRGCRLLPMAGCGCGFGIQPVSAGLYVSYPRIMCTMPSIAGAAVCSLVRLRLSLAN